MPGFLIPYFHAQEQLASGTNNINSSAGAVITIPLNTEVANTIAGASLSGDEVTLPAGTYYISAYQSQWKTRSTKLWFYNQTDGETLCQGANTNNDSLFGGHYTTMQGIFVLDDTKVCRLRGRATDAETGGWGQDHVLEGGMEVYNDVYIEQLAEG